MSLDVTKANQPTAETPPAPFYVVGCYAIPIRFLYGTAAEINFWDVVYFRAHETGAVARSPATGPGKWETGDPTH